MIWHITEEDVRSIAVGAGVLGTGGGGDPYLGELQLIELLRSGKTVDVIPASALADTDLGCGVSGMGAPTVGNEKLPAGDEMWQSVHGVEAHLHTEFKFIAIGEIGGGNALEPLITAAYAGLPVIDADPMGRAFPELQMDTFMIGGVSPSPFGLADGLGNRVVLEVNDPLTAERYGRALTVAMGASASLAMPVISGREIKEHGIHGTLTLCYKIGLAIRQAIKQKTEVLAALTTVVPATQPLFTGKIVDVARKTTGGFARGNALLEGIEGYTGEQLRIDIQNEYLVAWKNGQPIATVPDLICILDAESGLPIGTESLRYGLRLHVVGIPASRKLKTDKALAVVGPRAFGYNIDFVPLRGELPEEQIG